MSYTLWICPNPYMPMSKKITKHPGDGSTWVYATLHARPKPQGYLLPLWWLDSTILYPTWVYATLHTSCPKVQRERTPPFMCLIQAPRLSVDIVMITFHNPLSDMSLRNPSRVLPEAQGCLPTVWWLDSTMLCLCQASSNWLNSLIPQPTHRLCVHRMV